MSRFEGLEEVLEEFLAESRENLDGVERDLVALEDAPDDPEIVAAIFRAVHTIKGTCGFLALDRLETLTHCGESLLVRVRDGEIPVVPEMVSALLRVADVTRTILDEVEATEYEGEGDDTDLLAILTALREGSPVPAAAPAETALPEPAVPESDAVAEAPHDEAPHEEAPHEEAPREEAPATGGSDLLGDLLVQAGWLAPEALEEAVGLQTAGDRRPLGEILVSLGLLDADRLVETLAVQTERRKRREQRAERAARKPIASDPTVRVDVGLLDSIVDLVGELVLTRNQIVEDAASGPQDRDRAARVQQLSHLTTDLQERVLRTRMQPIETVWNKLPRVVRDLALACDKQVRVEMEGQDTELDKALVEALKDPLTHLVRNAVDHGIEMPAVRVARGKPKEGVLRLTARHDGGEVVIEIGDDGGGIDLDRVRAKALSQDLLTSEELETMSDRDVAALIFRPGFSTAEKVTNVSGRGVGMDVVKTNIEAIQGKLEIDNRPGQGTTIRIAIPLTLAIVPVLVVSVGGTRFAIPQVHVREIVRMTQERAAAMIDDVHDSTVLRLRDELVPLLDLRVRFEFAVDPDAEFCVVVVRAGTRRFGLVLDDVASAEEIVIKPLAAAVTEAAGFSGATVMGDGGIALVLDMVALADAARISEHGQHAAATGENASGTTTAEPQYLVCASGDRRVAVPFTRVLRLERVRPQDVERVEGRPVVQRNGALMPLLGLSSFGAVGESGSVRRLNVVVCEEHGTEFGLVVDKVLDAARDVSVVGEPHPGSDLASAITVEGAATEVLDPSQVAASGIPATLPMLVEFAEAN